MVTSEREEAAACGPVGRWGVRRKWVFKALVGRSASMSWKGDGERRGRRGREVEGVSRFPP